MSGSEAMGTTLLCGERLGRIKGLLEETAPLDGEFWECGVYKGGSALYAARVLEEIGVERVIRLFDTFGTGIPAVSEKDNYFRGGEFSDVNFDVLVSLFDGFKNVHFYKGVIPNTFVGLENCRVAVAHVDIYSSVKGALEFILPRIVLGGKIIVDDYGCESCLGAKVAVDEICKTHGISIQWPVSSKQNPQGVIHL